jgi:hypothetical protein
LEKIWWRRERIFGLVMNRWSGRGLGSVEEPESSVLFLGCHGKLGWLLRFR